MCKASILASSVIPAVAGVVYGISVSEHGLGAFHPEGQTVSDCVACVQDETRMEFSNIPPDLQATFGVSATAMATFLATGDDYHDEVRFDTGAGVGLYELAGHGIVARVAMVDVNTVDDVLDEPQTDETLVGRELVDA